MGQDLKDKFLSLPRAKELAYTPVVDMPIKKVKGQFGGSTLLNEEFMLRYIMKGTKDIEEMRKAGPYRKYSSSSIPLVQLLDRLSKQSNISHVQVQGRQTLLTLIND
jgi:oxaloacetate decarboxylase alpha subunit